MTGKLGCRLATSAKRAVGLFIAIAAFGAPISLGDHGLDLSECERRALHAYAEALRRCELALNPDPRLRCYEEAQAVYRRALEDCCEGGKID